jgi:hypothetical protein
VGKKYLTSLVVLVVLLGMGLPGKGAALSANTATSASKGLLITPVRQFLSVDAGKSAQGSLTVANHTGSPLAITVSVKQFSVADYTYAYTFQTPANNWLRTGLTTADLQPDETRNVPYSISPPAGSAPGGRYYTLLASATLTSQGITSTIQAADQLYVTVNGRLTTVSHLQSSSISRLVFGRTIPFSLQPINTGNTYSFVYVSGQLHGLLVKPPQTSSAHILIPGKVRDLSGSIASPVLPGVYHATYGYKTTAGWVIQQTAWIVYVPPWSIAFVLAVLLIAGKFLPGRSKRNSGPETDS